MRTNALACLLLLSSICHAASVTSNGAGGGEWSEPGTWAEGVVPADGDTVTIVAADVVTFDVDMSGWENGIAGLTCDGTMDCSTSIGTYCLKTSADISGTGRINCGSPETAYPSNCTMTFDFDSKPNSFECASGLTLNLHCTEPTHPVIALSEAAAAGQTELSVDTDVSGDIWMPGETVRIDAISRSMPDSEERAISMGGIVSGTITVDVGLANAKVPGARVVLITRNVRIIGSAGYAVRYMTGGVLGCEINSCAVGIGGSSSCTISGTISGCNSGVSSCSVSTISGTISGCDSGVSACSVSTISGTISGCYLGVADLLGCLISGTISGCNLGVHRGSDTMISGAISGCTAGMHGGSNTIQDAIFGGNSYDLRRVGSLSAYNTLFDSAVENYDYDTDNVPPWTYVASYDHDGVTGAFKAWVQGGVVVSDVNVAPLGYASSYRHMCTSSAMPCFRQELITVGPSQTLEVRGKILILDNHDVWAPRLELVDVRADPLVDASAVALVSAVIPKPLGRYYWQDVTARYTNTHMIGKQVWIRCSTQQSGNDIYEVWSARLQ
jgi:hypothetical protein